MGLCLADRRPVHSEGAYVHGPGQNTISVLLCPCSSGLAPRPDDVYLLLNSLVSKGWRIKENPLSGLLD